MTHVIEHSTRPIEGVARRTRRPGYVKRLGDEGRLLAALKADPRHSELSPTGKRALKHCTFIADTYGRFHIKVEWLATVIVAHPDTVRRALRKARALGLLESTHFYTPAGWQRENSYRLTCTPGPSVGRPQSPSKLAPTGVGRRPQAKSSKPWERSRSKNTGTPSICVLDKRETLSVERKADRVESALHACHSRHRERPDGKNFRSWRISCPLPGHAHGDRNPSAIVSIDHDGRVAAFCHVCGGGDYWQRLMRALGLPAWLVNPRAWEFVLRSVPGGAETAPARHNVGPRVRTPRWPGLGWPE